MGPLVSVIIPIYNSIQYIKECVDSVVDQSYKDLEIILIDDGSSDGSLEFIKNNYSDNKRVKILTHTNNVNKGVTETRRLGIDNSEGEFLAFLDADDLFEKDKIDLQVKILLENKDVVLVHSRVNFIKDLQEEDFFNDFSIGEKDLIYTVDLNKFLIQNHICNSTVMVRKKDFYKIKFTSNHAFQYEDWIQWILLSESGKFYYQHKRLANYRYHQTSSTASIVKNYRLAFYADFEKNLILEKVFRGKKNHKLILSILYSSVDNIYDNLFNKKSNLYKFYFYAFIKSTGKRFFSKFKV